MGARPLAYVLNVVLPPHIGEDWLRRFAAALGEDQARFGIHLAGGDSIGVPEGRLVLSATLFGDVPAGGALRRGAAQEGDRIMLSGTIGDAWLGLQATESKLSNISDKYIAFLKQRFNFPEPRLTLGRLLVGTARAAVDVSDGLAADLGHICSASGLCAELALDAIPLSPAARAAVAAGASVLDLVSGGDDYELVFTLSPEAVPDAQAAAAECGVAITDIGHMTLGPAGHVILRDAKGRPINLARKGWQHA
jgi:thiamine-monophosphate kinase